MKVVKCPICGEPYELYDFYVGDQSACPKCRNKASQTSQIGKDDSGGQTIKCPICGEPYKVYDFYAGDQSACPRCRQKARENMGKKERTTFNKWENLSCKPVANSTKYAISKFLFNT